MKRLIIERKEDKYPRVGPFYFYNGNIIAPDKFQKQVNPITGVRANISIEGYAGEHRDMWDNYMLIQYPELKSTYNDDHKALPRGRVDYSKNSNILKFWVTLDKCIVEQEPVIKSIYNISNYVVEFYYGTMNYKCKNCS